MKLRMDQVAVEKDGRDLRALEEILEVVVGVIELLDLAAQFGR